ncbi:double-stranded RNA binding motif domain-containing protein [Rhodococcus sp. DK176]|uniref:double-stranded RNA binding motif domain-containing protein n=2 Tax=Rhodococcus TaxID=1827 RepID=UPI00398A25F6
MEIRQQTPRTRPLVLPDEYEWNPERPRYADDRMAALNLDGAKKSKALSNPTARLMSLAQNNNQAPPVWEFHTDRPAHAPRFTATVHLAGHTATAKTAAKNKPKRAEPRSAVISVRQVIPAPENRRSTANLWLVNRPQPVRFRRPGEKSDKKRLKTNDLVCRAVRRRRDDVTSSQRDWAPPVSPVRR